MPTTSRKKRAKPRFLGDCRVQLQQTNGRLVSGQVVEILSLKDGITYKVQCDNDVHCLRLAQAQLRFAPQSPVWVQIKDQSKPGLVVAYDTKNKKYQVKMLADNEILRGIPGKWLRYNALQAVIERVQQENLIIKQEAQEEQQQQSSAGSTSQATITRPVVKGEVQQEEGVEARDDNRVQDAAIEIVTIEDSDEEEEEEEEEEEDTNSKQMSLEELLEIRRRNLPRNCVLNETANKFWSILYSPKHDVQQAIKCIQEYIDTYGASTRPKMNGGIGPVLHQRCLYWHLRGQCRRKGCKFQEDHIELAESEAIAIEAALEPVTTKYGPIYPPGVVLTVEKEDNPPRDNQQESISVVPPPPPAPPGRHDPRLRLRQQRHAATTRDTAVPLRRDRQGHRTLEPTHNLGRHDSRQGRQRDNSNHDTAPKRRRTFQCQDPISILLPAEFGEGFYRGALDSPRARTAQESFGCEWELECRRNGMSIVIRGDLRDQMEQSQKDIKRILCLGLPRKLRGKLLWDLNQLADHNQQDLLAVEGHLLEEAPDATIFMTIIPLKGTYVTNESLCVRDAPGIAERLSAAYGPNLGENACFVAVHLADRARDFGFVPSHIVLWSPNRRNAANCRNDFFEQGGTHHQDSEEECW